MRTTRRLIRQLIALVVLAAIVVGVPWFLIRIAGWPLPTKIPNWDNMVTAARQGNIQTPVVLKSLASIVWIVWVQLVWALAWEIGVNLRRSPHGEPMRDVPLVPNAVGAGAGRLVSVLFAVGLSVASTPQVSLARPAVVAERVVPTPGYAPIRTAPAPVRVSEAKEWCVTNDDTLWDIAERSLGDGSRASDILTLNPHIPSARDLGPGDVLRLPAHADVPADRRPVVTPVPTPVTTTNGHVADLVIDNYLPPTTIVIKRGDNLWNLSEARLDDAADAPVTDRATLDYLHDVIDANPDVVEDPNLIFPGERFEFPAIGDPPPLPPPLPIEPPTIDTPTPSTSPPPDPTPTTVAPIPTVVPTTAAPTPAPTPAPTSLPDPTAASVSSTPPSLPSMPTQSDATSRTDDGSNLPWLAGAGGATVVASGLLVAYRRARSRRRARTGRPDPATPERLVPIERHLVRAADVTLVRWANLEIGELCRRLDPRRIHNVPIAAEVSTDRGLELLWNAPTLDAPHPWEVADDGWSWRLHYDPEYTVNGQRDAVPIPALVTIGTRDDKPLLLNLEALGALSIDGDAEQVAALIRSIVLELGCGDELANSYVHLVNIEVPGIDLTERVSAADVASATANLASVVDGHRSILDTTGFRDSFQLRLGGDAHGRETTVVVAADLSDDEATQLVEASSEGRGAALLLPGRAVEGAAQLTIAEDGTARLSPLGLEFKAGGITSEAADQAVELLDEADEPDCTEPDAEPALGDVDDYFDRDDGNDLIALWDAPGTLRVRVLGKPTVEGRSLGTVDTSVVTYLACNGGSARDTRLLDAVWNGKQIDKATFWNRIATVRNAVHPHLRPRVPGSDNLDLDDRVVLDLDVLDACVAAVATVRSDEAIVRLEFGLALAVGAPFDDTAYDWAHQDQHVFHAEQLIRRAVATLVRLYLAEGDSDRAARSVNAGLRALPADEALYREKMRVEGHSGNLAAVRKSLAELIALLDRDAAFGPTRPSSETLELVASLTRG